VASGREALKILLGVGVCDRQVVFQGELAEEVEDVVEFGLGDRGCRRQEGCQGRSQSLRCGVNACVGSPERSDSELLGAVRSDPDAFAHFYDRYETVVVGYLARRVFDPELVADLTAEVFAAALHGAAGYRPGAPTAVGWLLTIAHNVWANSVRGRRVEARARLRLGIRDAVSFQEDELERVESIASHGEWLSDLLMRLPSEQAQAIRARVLEERDYGEIAYELQTSELVIRKRVSRGLASLRKAFEKEDVP
jgi:RNA polymerase sigma factor (sigma-70 family)